MKKFNQIHLNLKNTIVELDALKRLLDSSDSIDETVLLTFFKERPDLVCMIGDSCLRGVANNLFAWELDLFGYFRTGFAVGNSQQGEYLLIELESAADNMFHQQGKKPKREWHRDFNRGYNQLFDWFWLLEDFEHTKSFQEIFDNFQQFTGLLVIAKRSSQCTSQLNNALPILTLVN